MRCVSLIFILFCTRIFVVYAAFTFDYVAYSQDIDFHYIMTTDPIPCANGSCFTVPQICITNSEGIDAYNLEKCNYFSELTNTEIEKFCKAINIALSTDIFSNPETDTNNPSLSVTIENYCNGLISQSDPISSLDFLTQIHTYVANKSLFPQIFWLNFDVANLQLDDSQDTQKILAANLANYISYLPFSLREIANGSETKYEVLDTIVENYTINGSTQSLTFTQFVLKSLEIAEPSPGNPWPAIFLDSVSLFNTTKLSSENRESPTGFVKLRSYLDFICSEYKETRGFNDDPYTCSPHSVLNNFLLSPLLASEPWVYTTLNVPTILANQLDIEYTMLRRLYENMVFTVENSQKVFMYSPRKFRAFNTLAEKNTFISGLKEKLNNSVKNSYLIDSSSLANTNRYCTSSDFKYWQVPYSDESTDSNYQNSEIILHQCENTIVIHMHNTAMLYAAPFISGTSNSQYDYTLRANEKQKFTDFLSAFTSLYNRVVLQYKRENVNIVVDMIGSSAKQSLNLLGESLSPDFVQKIGDYTEFQNVSVATEYGKVITSGESKISVASGFTVQARSGPFTSFASETSRGNLLTLLFEQGIDETSDDTKLSSQLSSRYHERMIVTGSTMKTVSNFCSTTAFSSIHEDNLNAIASFWNSDSPGPVDDSNTENNFGIFSLMNLLQSMTGKVTYANSSSKSIYKYTTLFSIKNRTSSTTKQVKLPNSNADFVAGTTHARSFSQDDTKSINQGKYTYLEDKTVVDSNTEIKGLKKAKKIESVVHLASKNQIGNLINSISGRKYPNKDRIFWVVNGECFGECADTISYISSHGMGKILYVKGNASQETPDPGFLSRSGVIQGITELGGIASTGVFGLKYGFSSSAGSIYHHDFTTDFSAMTTKSKSSSSNDDITIELGVNGGVTDSQLLIFKNLNLIPTLTDSLIDIVCQLPSTKYNMIPQLLIPQTYISEHNLFMWYLNNVVEYYVTSINNKYPIPTTDILSENNKTNNSNSNFSLKKKLVADNSKTNEGLTKLSYLSILTHDDSNTIDRYNTDYLTALQNYSEDLITNIFTICTVNPTPDPGPDPEPDPNELEVCNQKLKTCDQSLSEKNLIMIIFIVLFVIVLAVFIVILVLSFLHIIIYKETGCTSSYTSSRISKFRI